MVKGIIWKGAKVGYYETDFQNYLSPKLLASPKNSVPPAKGLFVLQRGVLLPEKGLPLPKKVYSAPLKGASAPLKGVLFEVNSVLFNDFIRF